MQVQSKQSSQHPTRALSISLPLSLLRSGQLLALTPDSKGGLILQKQFHADWIPPGALLGGCYDLDCQRVYVAGKIRFYAPDSRHERAQSLQRRIDSIAELQDVINEPSSFRRAFRVLRHLSAFLSYRDMRQIPHELLAQLVGVNPSTVALFWRRYLIAAQKRQQAKQSETSSQLII